MNSTFIDVQADLRRSRVLHVLNSLTIFLWTLASVHAKPERDLST